MSSRPADVQPCPGPRSNVLSSPGLYRARTTGQTTSTTGVAISRIGRGKGLRSKAAKRRKRYLRSNAPHPYLT